MQKTTIGACPNIEQICSPNVKPLIEQAMQTAK